MSFRLFCLVTLGLLTQTRMVWAAPTCKLADLREKTQIEVVDYFKYQYPAVRASTWYYDFKSEAAGIHLNYNLVYLTEDASEPRLVKVIYDSNCKRKSISVVKNKAMIEYLMKFAQ